MSFNFLVRRQQSDDSGLAIVLPSPPNLSVCLVFWLNPTQCKPVTHFEDLFSRWGGGVTSHVFWFLCLAHYYAGRVSQLAISSNFVPLINQTVV